MRMVNTSILVVAALAAAGTVAWLLMRSQPAPIPATPSVTSDAPTLSARSPPPSATRYPIEKAAGETVVEPTEPLPTLDASDGPIVAAASKVVRGDDIERLFNPKDFARRIVATVDNLPRSRVPPKIMALRSATGPLLVKPGEGEFALDPRNAERYARYVDFFTKVDLGRAVGVYVHFYPLLQQAYRELGYPEGHFNDRLIAAIDDLLAAPTPSSLVHLAQPHVLYTFADPDLEARSAGQKIMLRMGPDNAQRVKVRLRELRKRLTGLPRS
ncbi:MAG: DUF3014 domain-containing protein [Casimicrobiaceae bacterium]